MGKATSSKQTGHTTMENSLIIRQMTKMDSITRVLLVLSIKDLLLITSLKAKVGRKEKITHFKGNTPKAKKYTEYLSGRRAINNFSMKEASILRGTSKGKVHMITF
jgi:hypothetical protein